MKLIVKTDYTINSEKSYISDQSEHFDKLKKYLEDIANEYEMYDKYHIESYINEYLWNEIDTRFDLNDADYTKEITDICCENLDELIEYFSYLIEEPDPDPDPTNCCDKYKSKYCPECGKKLN